MIQITNLKWTHNNKRLTKIDQDHIKDHIKRTLSVHGIKGFSIKVK